MKGTIIDFLKLAAEKPELARELIKLAGRYGFEFSDEVSDEDLDSVAGGALTVLASGHTTTEAGTIVSSSPNVCITPASPSPIPTPYPISESSGDSTSGTKHVKVDDGEVMTKDDTTKG